MKVKVGDIVETTLPNGNYRRGIVLTVDFCGARGLIKFVSSNNEMVYCVDDYVKVLNKK